MKPYLAAAFALWLASQSQHTLQTAVAVADFDEDGIAELRAVPAATTSDFIVAGDFDGDGHADIVFAQPRSQSLWFLRGNGRGDFEQPVPIEMQGAITALAAADINRPDGIADLVVGVATDDGPKVLVFEGPSGALRATPEVFPLPDEATDLGIGDFDRDYYHDLQITTRSG